MADLLLGERYRLQERIGEGATAEVYRATDQILDRLVAVKILRPQFAANPEFRARFLEEARAAARLTHPNIVGVYDVGVSENGETAYHYIVMELVEGPSLRDVIAQTGPLPTDRALAWTIQVLTALNYAHQRGIVHRDVKPANVLLTPDGQVKVADFGIAAAANTHQRGETGIVVGTVLYISPEQATGNPATAASDLYAVGVMLFEMLTGQVPYDGPTPVAVALQHVQAPIPSAKAINPRISPRLDAVLKQALAKDPAERLDAATFARELQSYLRLGLEPTSAMPVVARHPPSSAQLSTRPTRRRRLDWFTVVVGLLIFVAIIGIVPLSVSLYNLYRARPTQVPPATTVPQVVVTATPPPVVSPTREAPVEVTPPVMPTPTPRTIVVPNVVNRTLDEAQEALETLGFQVRVVPQTATPGQTADTVVRQRPDPDAPAHEGDIVELFVAQLPPRVQVPPVVGLHRADAEHLIEAAGLEVNLSFESSDRGLPNGWVIRQEPESGTLVDPNARVTIVVSLGPATPTPTRTPPTRTPPTPTVPPNTVEVPNVVGIHETEAKAIIAKAGLRVSSVNYQGPEDVPPDQRDYVARTSIGFVLSQKQPPGSRVPLGSGIDIAVRK